MFEHLDNPHPPTLEPAHRDEVHRRATRIRRRRRVALGAVGATICALAAVGLAVVIGGGGTGGQVQVISPATTAPQPAGAHPTETSTPSGSTTTPAKVPALRWPEIVVAHLDAGSFVALGPSLYADRNSPNSTAAAQPVTRIDSGTGRVAAVSVALPTGELAVAGQNLWLAASPDGGNLPVTFYRLDPTTLKVLRQVDLPGVVTSANYDGVQLAGDQSGALWAGYDHQLYRLDAASGAPLGHTAAANEIAGLALDDHGRLYDSIIGQSPSATPRIEQRSATTGALQASTANDSIAGAALVATDTGVWATYRTGMLGATTLYGADSLKVIGPPTNGQPEGTGPRFEGAGPFFGGAMGTTAALSGGVLWLHSLSNLTCADPATGTVRATETIPNTTSLVVVAALGQTVLAYDYSASSLLRVNPPSVCWSPGP